VLRVDEAKQKIAMIPPPHLIFDHQGCQRSGELVIAGDRVIKRAKPASLRNAFWLD